MRPKDLIARGEQLFKERKAITTLWQEIAENFYPQRADFTIRRYVGEEFAEHLYSSYPILVHRDLSNSFAAMLRPRKKEWFQIIVDDYDELPIPGKIWLDEAGKRMRRAMYDRKSQFVRATAEGDADFAAFGQCCITRDVNWHTESPHLLYRCWHLRDVAWAERADQQVGEVYIKWQPRIKELKAMFGAGAMHPNIDKVKKDQNLSKVDCMRLAVTSDVYAGQMDQGAGYPWMIVYLDVQNSHIINEHPAWSSGVTLPRWQTVSGSQYAYSPAAVAGLPDARLLQAMSLTLLEAGEMSVRPPMIATQDAIRGDIQLYSGGITWADVEYDERKGDVLRPITQDRRGLPQGYNERDNQMAMLAEAFYINKLTLPPPEGDMTAFEVGQRVEEYVRAALPLFEPMEHEYNGQLCEDTFDTLLRAGVFGSVQDMPRELQGREIHFRFESPLHEAIERKDASTFMESAELIRVALEMDPTALAHYDSGSALRAALEGIGVKHKHIRTERAAQEIIRSNAEQARAEEEAELAKTQATAANQFAAAQEKVA
ncbi:MAG: hypothetical protein AMJ84_00120 [Acidithiobacillales bacterium SM23_46]|nr:MAG: hypothetical protein AMJ84_00120 [Acidithiobacillales bacterium SM23_46]KPL29043.1 MAG: hypothetical protein AMJ72_00330 [Acidithiobacillales bacterium SM1_46]